MVIHDLKHPTDSTISQLEFLRAEILTLQTTVKRQASVIKGLKGELDSYKSEFLFEPDEKNAELKK